MFTIFGLIQRPGDPNHDLTVEPLMSATEEGWIAVRRDRQGTSSVSDGHISLSSLKGAYEAEIITVVNGSRLQHLGGHLQEAPESSADQGEDEPEHIPFGVSRPQVSRKNTMDSGEDWGKFWNKLGG